ncbi:HAD family hydrolase [Cellulomonas sp. Marseille-Q8402]
MTDRATPAAVLFDIDGTLVDSNFLHVHAWTLAFAEAGHPVDAWRIHRRIGMGSGRLLAELLGDDADRLADDVKERHTAHYAELADQLRAFDGARDLVRTLADRGLRVVLSTSAAPEEVEKLRAVLDVDDLVQVTGAEDVEEAKPEPDLVQAALDLAGVPAERAVFVGDAVWDVQAAERAGVVCVGVLSGGTSEAELRDAGARTVVEDAAALLRDLDRTPVGELLG